MFNLHTALIPAHLHIYFYIEKKNKITTTKKKKKKKKFELAIKTRNISFKKV